MYEVLDQNGKVINVINADESFMAANYSNYRLYEHPIPVSEPLDVSERLWRDSELRSTDWIVPITDHPQHDAYIAYRQELRDWPSTDQFPDTRPQLGE
jgi:hypothetical protein